MARNWLGHKEVRREDIGKRWKNKRLKESVWLEPECEPSGHIYMGHVRSFWILYFIPELSH